jgi:small-conductance mechanosensitive channel
MANEYHYSLPQQDTISGRVNKYIMQDTVRKVQEPIEITDTIISGEKEIYRSQALLIIEKIILSLVVLLFGFFFLKIITKTLEYFSGKKNNIADYIAGVIPIIQISGWLIISYIILGIIIEPHLEILITLAVAIGLAFGLGVKDVLTNVFAGMMIHFERPFRLGDKIRLEDKYGEVSKIGLRSTRIITENDVAVSIPNSEIMNKSISNSNSGKLNCQVVTDIYLPVNVDTVSVRNIAIEVARVSKYVYLDKPINVLFTNEVRDSRSFLKMQVNAYVMDKKYESDFRSELTELIIRELIQEGILDKADVS